MEDTLSLFETVDFNQLKNQGLSVRQIPRTTYDYRITIDEQVYDAYDIYEYLAEMDSRSGVYLTDEKMVKMLKKFGVITSGGGREYSASEGNNFEEFYKMIKEALREAGCNSF